jgi:DNA processing protein
VEINERQRHLLALCAIRAGDKGIDWSLLAREAMRAGGLEELEAGRFSERSPAATEAAPLLKAGLASLGSCFDRVDAEIEQAAAVGARLVTILDEDYPQTLRLIFNLPPFLFLRGTLWQKEDVRSVAVVGTRQASPEGLDRARRISQRLAEKGVVIVSGLARGIDSSAHSATIDAGGRTVAVIGTGITKTYPAENKGLADLVAEHGVVVSQFWPSSGPARWTFPRRNVVMSGIAQGTVVVEASSTSGAKMQARLALEHGKKVFLLRSLVTNQPWARTYVEKRGAMEVESIDDIVSRLTDPDRIEDVARSRQLTFGIA